MVIFGGLELVAATYFVHKYAENKREIEEEKNRTKHHRRRRSHDSDISHEHRHSHDEKYRPSGRRPSQGPPRPQQHQQQAQQAQHLSVPRPQPPRAHSAPPPQQQQQEPGYPPTGWPAHWEQSRIPEPRVEASYVTPTASQYVRPGPDPYRGGNSESQPPRSPRARSPRARSPRDRSRSKRSERDSDVKGIRDRHGRLTVEDDGLQVDNRSDPPPRYRE